MVCILQKAICSAARRRVCLAPMAPDREGVLAVLEAACAKDRYTMPVSLNRVGRTS